jgi:hypothetical protein
MIVRSFAILRLPIDWTAIVATRIAKYLKV